MAIIVALLAIIASCLLFGPHATLIMIALFALSALFLVAVTWTREWWWNWRGTAPYRRACRQATRERRRAYFAALPKMPKKDRLIAWIATLAIPGIFVLTWLGGR